MISLDDLATKHLDQAGTFASFLEGKLVQSTTEPPPFVDRDDLRAPDVAWSSAPSLLSAPVSLLVAPCGDSHPPISVVRWSHEVRASKLRHERKQVALAMAHFADRDTGRSVRPSMTTLANRVDCARETANRGVRDLLRKGWLCQTGTGPRGTKVYALTLPT